MDEIIKSLDYAMSLGDETCLRDEILLTIDKEYKNHPCHGYVQAILLGGFKTPEDEKNYENKLLESSKKGCKEAQYLIANRLYDDGKYIEALKLYKESANSGYAPSQWCYGLDHFNGIKGVLQPNVEKGLTYISYSAGQLYDYAIEFLIDIYSKGSQGIKPDNKKVEYYKTMLKWDSLF